MQHPLPDAGPHKATQPKFLTFTEVTKLPWMPRRRGGGRTHIATLVRWHRDGLWGVYLRALSIGGTWCTNEAWLLDFFEEVSRRRANAREAQP